MSGTMSWRETANRRWPDAYWIKNEGRFAVVSTCTAHVRITLHETLERAKEVKAVLDADMCMRPPPPGFQWHCKSDNHVVIDLGDEAQS